MARHWRKKDPSTPPRPTPWLVEKVLASGRDICCTAVSLYIIGDVNGVPMVKVMGLCWLTFPVSFVVVYMLFDRFVHK